MLTADVTALPGPAAAALARRDGTLPDGPGPQVRDHAQLFQLIALGRASAVLPESCRAQLRGDLAAVPVLDAPAGDDGDRLAAAQPVAGRRRAGPGRDPPVAPSGASGLDEPRACRDELPHGRVVGCGVGDHATDGRERQHEEA